VGPAHQASFVRTAKLTRPANSRSRCCSHNAWMTVLHDKRPNHCSRFAPASRQACCTVRRLDLYLTGRRSLTQGFVTGTACRTDRLESQSRLGRKSKRKLGRSPTCGHAFRGKRPMSSKKAPTGDVGATEAWPSAQAMKTFAAAALVCTCTELIGWHCMVQTNVER